MTTYQETIMNEYAKQYATNWFKMDNGSGNTLIDSKGSTVGTINGTTWLSDGGLSFDGVNDYIQFNSKILSDGAISIFVRIKIKNKPTRKHVILDSSGIDWSKKGIALTIESNGFIVLQYWNGTSTNVIYLSSNKDICDNQWHDILITWGGTSTSIAQMYIDDMTTPLNTRVSLGNNTISTNNLTIGRNADSLASADFTYYGEFEIKSLILFNQDISNLKINKTLILNKNEYKTYNSGWQTVSTTLPPESQFLSDGIDDLSALERKVQPLPSIKMNKSEILLQNGKLFAKTLDLNKYMDIRKIEVK